jgi:TRAP-type C4-dicarboxylate transport system permease small subunit
MNFLSRMDQRLVTVQQWLFYASAFIIFGMMLVTCTDILFRYAGHPFEGVFEGIEILLVVAIYLALADVQYRGQNICVEILVTRLTGKTRIAFDIFNLFLPVIVFATMVWTTGARAWSSFLMREATFKPAEFPIWVGRIAVTVGLTFLCLRLVIQISQKLKILVKGTGKSEEMT